MLHRLCGGPWGGKDISIEVGHLRDRQWIRLREPPGPERVWPPPVQFTVREHTYCAVRISMGFFDWFEKPHIETVYVHEAYMKGPEHLRDHMIEHDIALPSPWPMQRPVAFL
ncbi:MAG: hypothetical protein ACYTAN_13345 [Planctomycetota bacterium]